MSWHSRLTRPLKCSSVSRVIVSTPGSITRSTLGLSIQQVAHQFLEIAQRCLREPRLLMPSNLPHWLFRNSCASERRRPETAINGERNSLRQDYTTFKGLLQLTLFSQWAREIGKPWCKSIGQIGDKATALAIL